LPSLIFLPLNKRKERSLGVKLYFIGCFNSIV
jgi:hypothetical protein